MKVFSSHDKIQQFLKEQNIDGVTVTDKLSECNFLISGRYTQEKYNLNLKGVIIPYTGHNGIDLAAMREKDVMLFVTPTRSKYVAEKAISLTLSLLGNVINYDQLLRIGKWAERNTDSRTPWVSLQNKSIGLYGYGRIGKTIHKMLKGFGCDFYTIDRSKEYPSDITPVKNLTNLIQMSEVLIISAPLNESTEGMFNEQRFRRMKNKFLINVGRGKIVDEEALYNALTNNTLRGYASDVWYTYPKGKEDQLPSNYPLHELPNVVLSNHSGGYTENTNKEVNKDLIETIIKLRDKNYEDKLDLKNLL